MDQKGLQLWAMGLVLIVTVSCTDKPKTVVPAPNITQNKFDKQAAKMISIVKRLFSLSEVGQLKKEALSYSFGKAISCQDVAGECRSYYKLVSYIVQVTQNDELTAKERSNIVALQKAFQESLKTSRKVLIRRWIEYGKSQ